MAEASWCKVNEGVVVYVAVEGVKAGVKVEVERGNLESITAPISAGSST